MSINLPTKEEVLSEVQKVQYLFGLKREIRYKFERTIGDFNESVADHVYAMHIVATFFLPLENPENTWNQQRIFEMITWHDIDEIETGDVIGWKKTDADRAREKSALNHVLDKLPKNIKAGVAEILHEYTAQKSRESQFVKAIDKVEPLFHLYNQEGKELTQKIGLTYDASERIKEPYVKSFPVIKWYKDILQNQMKEEGFYVN